MGTKLNNNPPTIIPASRWIRPNGNTVKINCDASWNEGSNIAGIAVLARNNLGEVLDSENARVYASSSRVAEALAVRLDASIIAKHQWFGASLKSDFFFLLNRDATSGGAKLWRWIFLVLLSP
ncbi:hypothetical protein Godav_000844 [Gossypium davidsonii]|uniref:RNase H type-1 domain-containing protein n=2 Tax=Gossypium TaxID=3633 RepID=A0A7J8T0Y5_GOSDV|nr:hypothetical protein [Gossypium davidsonii]MBA0667781.1 hypothetical protein [Gossypium klotzschianum]